MYALSTTIYSYQYEHDQEFFIDKKPKQTSSNVNSESNTDDAHKTLYTPHPKKHTTVLIYMASDNDLNYFAKKNLDDMKKIGSSPFLNILVQMDGQGPYEKTKRFYVEKNNLVQVNKKDSFSEKKS